MLTLLAAISLVLIVLFSHNEWSSISSNSQKKNLQILLAMSEVCREMHDVSNKSSAYKYFKTFLKTHEIIRVSCTDKHGRIFMEERYYNPLPHPVSYFFKTFSPPRLGVWRTRNDNGVEILEASLNARTSKGNEISTHVDFSTQLIYQEMNSSMRQASAGFFIILSIAFAVGCIGTLMITRFIVKPMQTMAEAARIIGSGRLDYRIPIQSKDEMGRLASEFNEMANKLKEFDDMKRDFVSSITHDLRSPVTGIELCTDIIKELIEKPDYTKIPEQLFSINEHLQHLNGFIDSLLEVSKIESGNMMLDIKTVNLEEITDRVVRSFKSYASQKGIKLEFIVEEDIPDIQGDPERLYRGLTNIIGNAVKFTNSGLVSVHIQTMNGWQKVCVSDTGIGIPEHEINNIFSKFYRIDSGRQGYPYARQGIGLGLFIAKSIIEQHGGRIEVKSSPGKGSMFTVFLPINVTKVPLVKSKIKM
jgi:signal transduction histidine kinase